MNTFIIDFETTGLNPYHHDIIDIGCKLLNEDTTFQCLVRPKTKRLLSDFTTNLTGITNKMIVQQGKHYLSAYQDFINFILENSHINNAQFKKKTCSLKNTFYPPLMNDAPVKNSISMKKNIIVTGPNAAGKTTLLKSLLLNVLFSQQVGKGFYDKANINPYEYLHCYLNIYY